MAGPKLGNVVRKLLATEASPDQELLTRFLNRRDEGAFAVLVERHGAMVLGVCERVLRNSHDAEDACQAAFLVLARKANSVRKWGSLASWLHGVAWRVSRKLQTSLARRGTHERAAARQKDTQHEPADLSWREVRQFVDEELNRLPETYKAPLVLCYFEGRTQDEAARELGWSLGVVRGRLERGREKLRARLMRRGITASAALSLAALTPALSSAAVPPTLVAATSNASLAMAGGTALPAAIPANVAALAHEFLRVPLLTKLSIAFACVIAAVGIILLMFAHQPATTPPPSDPPSAKTVDIWVEARALEGEKAHAWCVAISPDGKLVASGTGGTIPSAGSLMLWDAASGEKLYTMATPSSVRGVAFAPDGKTLATAEHDGRARLRDTQTGAILLTFQGHRSGIDTVSFAPDGKTLATSSWDRTVKLWDTTTGDNIQTLVGHKNTVFAAAYGRDGLVASGCVDGTAKIWQASTGEEIFTLKGHRNAVHWLAFSPDGKTLATASWDKTVRLWDTATGKATTTLYGHKEKVLAVAFSTDGTSLAGCSGKWAERGVDDSVAAPAEVIVWDLTGKQKRSHTPHNDRVMGVAFGPDGTLASASWDGAVKLWKRETTTQLAGGVAAAQPEPAPAADKKSKLPDGALPPLRKDYPQEFYRSLKGDAAGNRDLALYGPAADQCVKFEPDGLRITLPLGYPGQRPGMGLATEFGVKGDFEITVNFEILQAPVGVDAGQRTEFVLLIAPKEPPTPDVWLKANQNRASLSRQVEDRDNISRFLTTSATWLEEPIKFGNEQFDEKEKLAHKNFPSGAMTGRLRLVRAGAVLHFLAAEDLSDDFALLHTAEFGDKDLKSVRIVAATGSASAAFDVRASELRIRAEAFPTATATVVPATTEVPKLAILVSLFAVGSVCGLLMWMFQRRRKARSPAEGTTQSPNHQAKPAALMAVQCAACGKNLKVKKQMAGRKVKCPACGKTIIVREA